MQVIQELPAFDLSGKKNICYRNLPDLEKTFSSTWRELEAIRFSLLSSIKKFEKKCTVESLQDGHTIKRTSL